MSVKSSNPSTMRQCCGLKISETWGGNVTVMPPILRGVHPPVSQGRNGAAPSREQPVKCYNQGMSGVAGIQRMYALPHEERVLKILRAYGATRARLFGSAARNELTPTSDIDILVEFGNDSGYQAFCKSVDAAVELEQELHRPVDLALSIDPRMWQYIEPDLIELPL